MGLNHFPSLLAQLIALTHYPHRSDLYMSTEPPNVTTKETLAGPMGEQCCAAPAAGLVLGYEGLAEPCGAAEDIAGVRTYVVRPQDAGSGVGRSVVLYFSDVFGPFYVNAQLTMDYWAAGGACHPLSRASSGFRSVTTCRGGC